MVLWDPRELKPILKKKQSLCLVPWKRRDVGYKTVSMEREWEGEFALRALKVFLILPDVNIKPYLGPDITREHHRATPRKGSLFILKTEPGTPGHPDDRIYSSVNGSILSCDKPPNLFNVALVHNF